MGDLIATKDLSALAGLRNQMNEEDLIEARKRFSKIMKECHIKSKRSTCYYCGQECDSFCNSHTVPAFCLRYISENGKLRYANSILDLPVMNESKGINDAGTFKIICRQCDSKLFQQYENEKNYDDRPTIKMLSQIAMKNCLNMISKRNSEKELYGLMNKHYGYPYEINEMRKNIIKMDESEFAKALEKAKRVSIKPYDDDYCIGVYINLSYRVPVAFQGMIALVCDLNGDIVNNIYNHDSQYEIKYMNMCIFPFDSKSVIMCFVEKGNKRYRRFFKQMNKKTEEEQLSIINYILFAYTEDYFISPNVPDTTIRELKDVSGKCSEIITSSPLPTIISEGKRIFDLEDVSNIPNLLSNEYRII